MNLSTTVAVAETEALAVADKLVATTRGHHMGTDNNQLRQWWACRGVGGAGLHGGVVGARGKRGAAARCGVGGAVAGRWWR
jgi:hypothetical protein